MLIGHSLGCPVLSGPHRKSTSLLYYADYIADWADDVKYRDSLWLLKQSNMSWACREKNRKLLPGETFEAEAGGTFLVGTQKVLSAVASVRVIGLETLF